MKKLITRFAKDESGATAIEYGLIAALISVVIIGVLSTIGTNLTGKFQEISDKLGEGAADE
jgi:pilus assembly protein Flp/PilA